MPKHNSKKSRNIAELVARQCEANSGFEVLTFVDVGRDGGLTHERRTFGELMANARRLGTWLRGAGVGPGDRFVLMMNNHPEFVEAMLAASLIGAVFVPIDPRSVGEKLVYMLNFVDARAVVAGDYALDALTEVADQVSSASAVLLVDSKRALPGPGRFRIERSAELPTGDDLATVEPDPNAPMFMMFTSGTTGNPKAVVRTHGAYMAGVKGLRALGVEARDVIYTGLPLSHINAQATLSIALATPLRAVISRRFTKSRLWDICRAQGCTVFTLLGGMIPEIYSVPEQPDDAVNPVRLIICSGMPAQLWNDYRRRFGVELTELYGSTEAGGVLINVKGEGPPGSMGKPPKGTLAAVLNDKGEPCAPGELGELCFRPETGEPRPVTYFMNEEASRQKIRSGWYRSGDIAHVDEEGWFYFDYRAGGGVRRNGEFVNTSLVETVLARSPLVEDVFVYGVSRPNNVAGEKTLVAAVVLKAGAQTTVLAQWCVGKLQKNEIPEIWQVLPAIPKTISEKPIERECAELLNAGNLAADASAGDVAK